MEHTLGSRLRAARKNARLTASQLASVAGVTEDAIRKIESGSSKQPSFATGLEIARALGVSPLVLAYGESEIRTLRASRTELEALGVVGASVFGSVARGDATPSSDVDVLVETRPDAPFSLLTKARIRILLKDRFGRVADVVTRRNVEGTNVAHILDEAVRAF
jgi:predicted nucleotidyltransferase